MGRQVPEFHSLMFGGSGQPAYGYLLDIHQRNEPVKYSVKFFRLDFNGLLDKTVKMIYNVTNFVRVFRGEKCTHLKAG